MTRNQIDRLIKNLAHSQGLYGRILNGNYGSYSEILDWLVNEVKPKTDLDVILAIEEG